MVIEAAGITVNRRGRDLIRAIDLAAAPGEMLAILGPNGAGKSTLLACLGGDIAPTAGVVRLGGRPIRSISPPVLARQRALLPQSAALAFDFTSREVVALGCLDLSPRSPEGRTIVDRCLEETAAHPLAGQAFPTLSGGEKQRVQLARILCQLDSRIDAAAPAVLLLDEPVASLDVHHQHAVLDLVRRRCRHSGVTAVVVLHDPNQALRYADRAALLSAGRLVADAPPAEALRPALLEAVYGIAFEALSDRGGRPVLVASPA